jgi:arylsulfatase A-like enzyme
MIRKILSWTGWAAFAITLAVIVLHIVNAIRIDMFELNGHVEEAVDRAEAISEQAVPEYQDLALARLAPNPLNGEFYRFDDNIASAEITNLSSEENSSDVKEYVFRLEFGERPEPSLVAAEGQSTREERDGFLVVTQRGKDYMVNETSVDIPLASISEVVVRARAKKGNRFGLLWAAEGREDDILKNSIELDLIADGEFHTYIVEVQNAFLRGVDFDEDISAIGIRPSNIDGDVVEIDFIRLVSKLWKYQRHQIGTSYETVEGELRPVLYMIGNRRLEYTVRIPEQAPRLTFGTAALLRNGPLAATVSVVHDDETTQIFESAGPPADRWQNEELDFARWAGEEVRVVFDVQGASNNVVLWSNPMIQAAPRDRFNVILILEDALRADHLSTQGNVRETSPEKTKLMNERGIVFTNAHSPATKTRPSVAALMTALYATATGVWDFSSMLSDRYLTMAEVLRAQGFVTASFIQNGQVGPYAGGHQGFSALRDSSAIGKTTEDMFDERTLQWLEENRDRNFFLYLHAIDPHGVYDPPVPHDRWYLDADPAAMVGERPLPDANLLDPEWAETPVSAEARRLLYDGEIRHNDEVIGRFIHELDRRGLLDDTLLVFVSDHGEWMGERGRWEHDPPGNQPVIHVPLMVVYPKVFATPKRIEESVQLIDVMPTILELASVDTSHLLMHGDSLVSLIQGEDPEHWRNRVTVSEEPMAMDYRNPCVCGSLFYDQWQLHGTRRGFPGRIESTFLKSVVYRFRDDGVTPVTSFLPDLSTRILRTYALWRIQSANIDFWHTITEGEASDIYKMDPETLEELRGLGYVN